MNYQTYDITGLMKPGRNGIGVTLASGWWSEAQTFVVKNFNYFGDKESLLAKVVMKYEDGSREVFGNKYRGLEVFRRRSLPVFQLLCRRAVRCAPGRGLRNLFSAGV